MTIEYKPHLSIEDWLLKEAVKHILVTGPSGSGKSVYANKIAKEEGIPLISLDKDKRWLDAFNKEDKRALVDQLDPKVYKALRRTVAQDALKSKKRSVIEGTQIYGLESAVVKKHDLRLIMTPKREVVKRRLQRRRNKGTPVTPRDRKIAKRLFSESSQRHKSYRKFPNSTEIHEY